MALRVATATPGATEDALRWPSSNLHLRRLSEVSEARPDGEIPRRKETLVFLLVDVFAY